MQSNSRVTAAQIARLPIYQRLQVSRTELMNRIHEDIKILRESGIDVVSVIQHGTHYYYIDASDEVP
ncbi:hypothetical protein RQN30_01120 [Arcanobacterium hippocoleae]